jgi:hypothetical protein
MGMSLGTWNVWRLYGSGSLKTVIRELEEYRLCIGVQEVRQNNGSTGLEEDFNFFREKGN